MIALLFASVSFAATELSLELGSTHAPDDGYQLFSDKNAMGSWGARVGFGLSDRTSLLVDWQHSGPGGVVETSDDTAEFEAALTVDQLAVGPRFGIAIQDTVTPYVTVQAVAMRGRVRLDGDPSSTDEVDQWKDSALTGGGLAMAGAQVVLGEPEQAVRFSGHLEMGYGYALPLEFGDYGSISFHGFALRGGAGIVF
jgi:hypothetical protein